MFRLHDKTRRLLTLFIFLLLGPTLLLVVVTKVCSRHSIRTVVEWETLLGNSLGKRVEIESLTFPAPGVVRFSQFQVIDPESEDILLQIPQWELIEMIGEMPQRMSSDETRANDAAPGEFYEPYVSRTPYQRGFFASVGFSFARTFGRNERYWQCEIPSVSCYASTLRPAKDMIADLLAKRPGDSSNAASLAIGTKPVVIHVGELDIFSQHENCDHQVEKQKYDYLALKNLNLEFRPTSDETTLCAMWHLSDAAAEAKPFHLSVSRLRNSPTLTDVQFSTGSAEIPATLLARLDPFFEDFGSNCRFNGTMTTNERRLNDTGARSRSFELKSATLSDIALDSFLRDSIPFRMSGTIDQIKFESIVFRSDSVRNGPFILEYAKGILFNGQGVASWPGLRQLVEGTKLKIVPEAARPPETDVSFRNATFAFIFDAQGIRLFPGEVTPSQTSPLLSIDNHCEVYWPHGGHVIRYSELLAALARPNSSQIPLMSETRHLISTLPISTAPVPENHMMSQRNDVSQQFSNTTDGHAPQFSGQPLSGQPQNHDLSAVNPSWSQPIPPVLRQATPDRESPVMGTVPQLNEVTTPPPTEQPRQHDNRSFLASNQISPPQQTPQRYAASVPEPYSPPQNANERRHMFLEPSQQQATGQQSVPQTLQQSTLSTLAGGPLSPSANNSVNVQPAGIPYGANAAQHYSSHYPTASQRRVIIPSMTLSANKVQTTGVPDRGPGTGSDVPTFVNPFETQVASAHPAPQSEDSNGYALPAASAEQDRRNSAPETSPSSSQGRLFLPQ